MQTILLLGNCHGVTKFNATALAKMGYSVTHIYDNDADFARRNTNRSLYYRIRNKLGFIPDKYKVNKQALDFATKTDKLDIVWVEKCPVLTKTTMSKIKQKFPNCLFILLLGDDMLNKSNQSYYFLKALPLYDYCFSTKSFNCHADELPALGAKNCHFVFKSIALDNFKRLELSVQDKAKFTCDVGFVGSYEYSRACDMLYLAENGIRVKIFGNGWHKFKHSHINLQIGFVPLDTSDYIKAINAAKINLGFLRKENRDLHTDRSLEIPACEAFMLAERTSEHKLLYKEAVEAEFFSGKQEMYKKVKYYLANELERETIAKQGRISIINNKHFSEARLQQILSITLSLP